LMCPDPTGSDPMCPDPTGNPFSQNGKGQAVSDNQLTGDPKGLHQASFPDPRRDPPSYYRRDEHSSDYRDNLVDFRRDNPLRGGLAGTLAHSLK
ncbi:MAG: hypothetical protein LBJ61_04250, partial [Deltaproteobacteria bacterium]|nr:hypothetical protein [Deltaproteobacteria bacterium]